MWIGAVVVAVEGVYVPGKLEAGAEVLGEEEENAWFATAWRSVDARAGLGAAAAAEAAACG